MLGVVFFFVNLLKLPVFKSYIGTGKGGTSIWGKKFEDEFHESLRVCILFSVVPVGYISTAQLLIDCVPCMHLVVSSSQYGWKYCIHSIFCCLLLIYMSASLGTFCTVVLAYFSVL